MLDGQPFPSLASIRAFEAAARLGSFAKAGAELGMTGAAISYHVRQLERQIGVTLFERGAQSVVLTEAGTEVATEASRFFASLRATFVKAATAHGNRLSLTALPTLGTSWLTPRLGEFRQRYPEIEIALELSQEPRELGDGRFDAAVRHGDGSWPGLRSVRLFPCVFMPLCTPQLRDDSRAIADPRAPSSLPLLGRADWWKRWYEAAGFPDASLDGRFGTTFAAEHLDAAAAIAGHGVTIGSPILFSDELAAGRLVPVDDLLASDGCYFWFAFPIVRSRSSKIDAFAEWIRSEAQGAMDDLSHRLGPNARARLLQLQSQC